jgi:hypothetical protein
MALSGTITKAKGTSTSNQYIDAKIVWSATQSIDGNYSMVTATLYYSRNNSGYTTYGTWSGSLTINGTKKTGTTALTITYNSNTQAITNTVKVPHNNDGTKTITISATGSMPGTSLSSTSISESITLTTIPRAATINSLSCSTAYLDGTLTYKYTPTTTNYYIRGNLSLNLNGEFIAINSDNNGKPSSTSQQTKTIKLSAGQLETIYKKIPSSTSATLRLTLRTYSDSSYTQQIGDYTYKEVKLTVPTSVKPAVGNITLDPTNVTINGTSYNYLIKGKNQLSISVVGSSAGIGSSIKSYAFSGPSLAVTQSSASTSISSVSNIASFTNEKATLTYTVTATDTRNRSSAPKTQTIECYDYQNPYFSSFKTSRTSGTLVCTYTPVFSSINGKNLANVEIHYITGKTERIEKVASVASGQSISTPISLGSIAATYRVYAVIIDGLGSKGQTATKTVYGESRIMNVTTDGTGVAFGKMAEHSNMLECKWPIVTGSQFGCTGAYGDRNFNIFCQWADGANHDVLVRNTDGVTVGLGWIGDENNSTVLDIRPQQLRFRGAVHGNLYFANDNEGNDCKARIYADAGDGIADDHILYLRTGTNTSAGVEAGIAINSGSVYVPSEHNDGIMSLGSSGRKWNQLYAASSTISTSDRNKKQDITDMSDTQEQLFNQLKPVTYKLKEGNSGRTHYGFISQDVEEALTYVGLTSKDFAGFCKDEHIDDNNNIVLDTDGNIVYDYSLRYSEFIALNTHMIQKLQDEIKALKAEINEMKNT